MGCRKMQLTALSSVKSKAGTNISLKYHKVITALCLVAAGRNHLLRLCLYGWEACRWEQPGAEQNSRCWRFEWLKLLATP